MSVREQFVTDGVGCVSIYCNEREGAVIALYSDVRRTSQPELALSVYDGVPRLQVRRSDGTFSIIDLRKTVEAEALTKTR